MKVNKSLLFLIYFLLFYSCGVIRKEIEPKYKFELGKSLNYKMSGEGELIVDIGLLSYNSKVTFSATIVFTPLETNENGYKMRMDIKDAKIEEVPGQINTAYHIGVNSLRTILSDFYIDENGKAKVFLNNVEVAYFAYIVNLFFPDLNEIKENISFKTNIPGWWQKTPVISVYEKKTTSKRINARKINFSQSGIVNVFEKEDFEKSVEPTSITAGKYTSTDEFDLFAGKILNKQIDFDVKCDLPMKQGIFTVYLKIYTKGNMKLAFFEIEA